MRITKLNKWHYETYGLELSTSLTGEAANVPYTLAPQQAEDLVFIGGYDREILPPG